MERMDSSRKAKREPLLHALSFAYGFLNNKGAQIRDFSLAQAL